MVINNFPLLKKLSIVIPTYNRQSFALRIIEYWSGKEPTIIILDGSKNKIDNLQLKNIGKNIKYIHLPIGYYSRLHSVINMIETDYVLLGCDDEFYIPSALNSCIQTISNQSQLVACCGRAIGFNFFNNKVSGYDIYPKLIESRNSNQTNHKDRIKKHFLNYEQSHTYAICKSNIWKIAAQTIFSKEYSCYSLHEIQFEFLMSFAGKSEILPELMWLRSDENQPLRDMSPSLSRFNTIENWWYLKKYKNERLSFINHMNKTCIKINKLNKNNQSIDVESTIKFYLENSKKNRDPLLYKIIISCLRYLPTTIKNKIKLLVKYLKYKLNKSASLIQAAKSFQASGVKIDFEELNKIEEFINSFHKNKNTNIFKNE